MKQPIRRLFCILLTLCLLTTLLPAVLLTASAAEGPQAATLVWDMENVPEDLYEANWAMNLNAGAGHTDGAANATRAEGKGVDGSTAVALTFTELATLDRIWGDGIYLRICEDETADNQWYGATEIWFWLDLSEFANSEVQFDFMVDGVHPALGKTYWIEQDGKRTEGQTIATYAAATFGRIQFPMGFKGWVGFPADTFDTTIGTVQNLCFTFYPGGDGKSLPLSAYVDEVRIVREDTSSRAIYGEGELFNKDTAKGDYTLYTNLTDVHQRVKSYGASGAWWSTAAGTGTFVDDMLKMVFTDEGAGLNNYRHNVGGSVMADLSDAGTGMKLGNAVPSPLTEDGKYDEDKDLGAYTVLMKLVELGTIDNFTLFMNSPPSTMTNNAMTYCDPWGDTKGNLRDDCFDAYASYVVDMVQLYNYLGVPVSYVSPINEPQWAWNAGTQEGCYYSADDAKTIIDLVAQKLAERCEQDNSLSNVKVSFADSGNWTDKSYVNFLYLTLLGNSDVISKYDHIACHSYGDDADGKKRAISDYKKAGAVLPFRQTEYGPTVSEPDYSIETAMNVARVMYEDLSILDVDGWSYWLTCGGGDYSDGLVYYNQNSSIVQPTKRLWAMGQYARFTKNATRVGVDEYGMPSKVYTTAYVNRDSDALVYVVVNDSAEDRTFSFAGLPAGSVADVYETSAIRNLELRGTMTADSGYNLPAQSITTFVFKGMDLSAVVSANNPDNPSPAAAVKADFDVAVFDKETTGTVPAAADTTDATESTEATAPTESAEGSKATVSPFVYGGIGIGALAAAAAVLAVIAAKKKKASKPERKKPFPDEETDDAE